MCFFVALTRLWSLISTEIISKRTIEELSHSKHYIETYTPLVILAKFRVKITQKRSQE